MPKSGITKGNINRAKPAKPMSNRKHVLWTVRIGRQRGHYDTWDEADDQVCGYSRCCHMGFTKHQVKVGWHEYYINSDHDEEQMIKIMEDRTAPEHRPTVAQASSSAAKPAANPSAA